MRHFIFVLFAFLAGCSAVAPTRPVSDAVAPHDGYYFGIQWRNAATGTAIGPELWVGPYPTLAWCRDTLGSELYSHPLACHVTGPNPPANCAITGNGAAYPKDYPDLAHAAANGPLQIPTSDCTAFAPKQPFRLPWAWYFIYYDSTGAHAVRAADYKAYLAKMKADPAARMGLVHPGCPNAPFFSVGFDNACD